MALESHQRASALRLVSRDVNVLVLPLLFRTLTFTTTDDVTRFTTTVLPKRRIHIPALKSNLHTMPRALSSYAVESLALAVSTRLPSIELALASVAPAFTSLKNLAITGQDLSAHAYWLRQHPIRPKRMMIPHYGRPHLVNYREPLFSAVTHLFTSVLFGHRSSSVVDLPALTHLAVHARFGLSEGLMNEIATQLYDILAAAPNLRVLVISFDARSMFDARLEPWLCALGPCLRDKRICVLPYHRSPSLEWDALVSGESDIWAYAKAWQDVIAAGNDYNDLQAQLSVLFSMHAESIDIMGRKRHLGWDIDLVERDNFQPPEDELTERCGLSSFPVVLPCLPALAGFLDPRTSESCWSF